MEGGEPVVQFKKRTINSSAKRGRLSSETECENEADVKVSSQYLWYDVLNANAMQYNLLKQIASSRSTGVAQVDANHNEVIGASVTTVFNSSNSAMSHQYSGGAFHYNEIDAATDRDARAIHERNMKLSEVAGDDQYRGQGAYRSFVNKDSSAAISNNKISG